MFVRKASQNRPIDNLTVILTKTVHFWTMDVQAPVNTELNDRFLEPSINRQVWPILAHPLMENEI
jgi:hypothetical protein